MTNENVRDWFCAECGRVIESIEQPTPSKFFDDHTCTFIENGCTCYLLPEVDMDGSAFSGRCRWCEEDVDKLMRDASINHEGPIG